MSFPPFLKNPHNQAILALITANIIWGAASPIFKWALTNIPPFSLAFIRFFTASLLLLPFVRSEKTSKRDGWEIALVGFFGVTVNVSFFFLGLQRTQSINAPLIGSSGPIFILILSVLFLKEKANAKKIFGTTLGLLGMLFLLLEPLLKEGVSTEVWGNLFFVLATLGAVGYTLVCKELSRRLSVLRITAYSFLLGSLPFLPLALSEYNLASNWLFNLDVRGVVGILFGVFFSSLAAYLLWAWGLAKIPASEADVFFYLDPVVAVVLAYFLLGEVITPFYLLGAALVFGGIFVVEGRIPYHPIQKLKGNPNNPPRPEV